jgi:4-amino-4-deoxy-L-arabinose transferase-like glycosyltransferase
MMTKKLIWILLIATAAIGLWIVWYSTPKGMGMVNDSVSYINGARGLAAGTGFAQIKGNGNLKPIAHFPPMFSVLLAAFQWIGMDAIPAARIINAVLFALNIILVGLLIRRISGSDGFAWIGAGLFALSDSLITVHAYILSEPLFLFLSFLCLICLIQFFESAGSLKRRVIWLAVAGLVAALSYLTRYVGGALLGAAVLALLLYSPTWKQRGQRIGIFLAASIPLIAAWSVRNWVLTGSATNRQMGWHPISVSKLLEGSENFWAFVLPQRFDLYHRFPPAVWAVLLALLLVGLGAVLAVSLTRMIRSNVQERRLPLSVFLVLLFAVCYLGYVVFSMLVFDASTLFEKRILAPFCVCCLILAACLGAQVWKARRFPYSWIAIGLAFALLLSFTDDARKTALALRLDGQGYASSYWTNSELLDAVRKLPPVTIYSNRSPAVLLLTDRECYALISPTDPVTQVARPKFDATQAAIRQAVQEGRAVMVIFNAKQVLKVEGNDWFRELVKDVPVMGEYKDGTIFGLKP